MKLYTEARAYCRVCNGYQRNIVAMKTERGERVTICEGCLWKAMSAFSTSNTKGRRPEKSITSKRAKLRGRGMLS